MELWLDTTDVKIISEASELGILSGVTTNPSILGKEKFAPEYILKQLLDIQSGYVAVQVTAEDLSGMLKQAEKLSKLSSNNRVIVKIPASHDGFKAMALLTKQGIATLATAMFETRQLMLSSLAGAAYIAPYFNRIELTGNAITVLKEMQETIGAQKMSIKIMAAAIHSVKQFCDCARLGIPAITVPVDVYLDMFNCPKQVDESLEKFRGDWLLNKEASASELFCH